MQNYDEAENTFLAALEKKRALKDHTLNLHYPITTLAACIRTKEMLRPQYLISKNLLNNEAILGQKHVEAMASFPIGQSLLPIG